jgi:hypothetical protein
MDHTDHVALLKPANLSPGGTWADLGAGSEVLCLNPIVVASGV